MTHENIIQEFEKEYYEYMYLRSDLDYVFSRALLNDQQNPPANPTPSAMQGSNQSPPRTSLEEFVAFYIPLDEYANAVNMAPGQRKC